MIKSKIHTQTKNEASIKRLVQNLGYHPKSYVTIGIHEDAGKYTKGNEPDVVEVALWNEFGTENTPARSFVRSTVDDHQSDIENYRIKMINNIIEKGWDLEKALSALGFYIQTLIQNKIKSNVPPAYGTGKHGNDSAKIARLQKAKKDRGVPFGTLQDSQLLLRSVGFKVYLV